MTRYEIRYIEPGDVRLYDRDEIIGQFETEEAALDHQASLEMDDRSLVQILNNQTKVIANLGQCLKQVADLSTNWKHGNEGVHLLRIQDLVRPFVDAENIGGEPK